MSHILSHTLDKVRYFRNLLITNETRAVRIIIGKGDSKKVETLSQALSDMADQTCNQICLIDYHNPVPKLMVKGRVKDIPPILLYFRQRPDSFLEALVKEYDDDDCEVILFEKDPTL
jgi:hypothetical protein